MLDVQSMGVFLAVAENLSFTRAAEQRFLTQSAVSHQIARLEQDLGVALFERHGRRVELTPAGHELARHARRLAKLLDEARAATRAAAVPDVGHLRIGASSTACQYVVPEALREFRECYPRYRLSVTPGDSPAVGELLAAGQIDLGIMIRPDGRPKLRFHALFEDRLGVVVAAMHPWAAAGKVDRATLADQKLVLYSRASATWPQVERHMAKLRVPVHEPIELGSIEAIKELVKLGLGVAVLAPWVVRQDVEDGSLAWLPLPGPAIRRTWCVAHVARPLTPAEQTFVGLCGSASARFRTSAE